MWTRLTEPNGRNIDEVTAACTGDGVLHIVYRRERRTRTVDLLHRRVFPNGDYTLESDVVLKGWSSFSNPALLIQPDGTLRLMFAGLDDADNLRTATAPASADLELQEGCCSYDSDVAVDAATGETVVAWFSNVDAQYGILVRPVHPALGAVAYAPGSARADREATISPDQRTPITSRLGAPGIYLAYWHTQVRPGLTLTATPGDVVVFRVTDAGDPVAGRLPAETHAATATRTGYTSASVRVRAR